MTLIEDLLDIQFPNDIKISPNSQQVIYSTTFSFGHKKGDHETSTIWVADTGYAKSSRQVTSGLYNDRAPRWNPDGNSIAFISDRAKQGERSAIYVLPIKVGGEPYPITPTENERTIDRFEFSPDGKFIAYTSADEKTLEQKAKEEATGGAKVWGEDWPHHRLRLVHIETKKVTTLLPNDAHAFVLAWNHDGSQIAVTEAPNPDIESPFIDGTKISIIDVKTQKVRSLCVFPCRIDQLTWAEDETIHFIAGYKADSRTSALSVYSIDLSASDPKFERAAHGEEDDATLIGKAGKDVTLMVQHGMADQIRMLGGKTLLSKKKEIVAYDAAFTTDSDEMIVAIVQGDTSTPPEVFTTTASGGSLVQVSNHGQSFLDSHSLSNAHFLRCRSDDDQVDLDALYVPPVKTDGKPSAPHSTLVFPHGGPYGRVTDTFNPSYYMWSNVLTTAGYGVLFPNYRGGSGRGDAFASHGRGGVGTWDYDDVITLTQHAIDEGYADKEKLVIGGWSQGGFMSFIASVRNGMHGKGWKFKAAIPGAGVSDADTMPLTSDIGKVEGELAGGVPWQRNKDDITGRKGSALWEFKKAAEAGVIPPMLILHGEEDPRCPLEQATGMRRALQSIGATHEMVVYPREPHLFNERKHLVDMAERVLKFVDTHVGSAR